MEFHEKRRQQFLGERHYADTLRELPESIAYFATNPYGSGRNLEERTMLARMSAARDRFRLLMLKFTAGELVVPLRGELEEVVASFERYGEQLWQFKQDRSEPVFDFHSIDDYCELMQLVGLCYLLHRRDLLPRIARLQDGENGTNGGADALLEEFMLHAVGADKRFQSDYLFHLKPYEQLFYGLTEEAPDKQLKEINLYLKRWYKDLVGTGWHDSHKPNEAGEQGGYYGYWAFEAGAAVLLLGIEDDSSLHQYLYYPKDLVAWAREHQGLSGDTSGGGKAAALRLRCEASEPCPREGWWFTPAKADSRRHFMQGEVMPAFTTDYGATVWQWDELQKG
jgi:hypothetical protein